MPGVPSTASNRLASGSAEIEFIRRTSVTTCASEAETDLRG